jgi:hypothetical protein
MSRSEYDNPNNMMPGAVRVGGVNTPSRPTSGNNPNLMRTPTSSVGTRGTYNSSPSHTQQFHGQQQQQPPQTSSLPVANSAIPSRVSNSQPNSARSSPSTANRGRNVPSSGSRQQTSAYPSGGGGYPQQQQQFYGQQQQPQPPYQQQQQQQFRGGNLSPNSSQYDMRSFSSVHNSPGFGAPGNDMADIHPADLQMLLGMGFSQSQAVHALRTKNYNVNAAAEYLLES